MTDEEVSIIQQSAIAEDNRDRILACRANIQANFLVLAKLLKDNRDKSLWKLLHHDSFEAFLGDPALGFSRSRAYGLIQLYEKFVDKLHISPEEIIEIGNSKLLMIAGRVEENVDEWMSKAKHLSKSDLRLEIDGAVPGVKVSPPKPSASPGSCVNGCQGDVDKHHFPVGRSSSSDEAGDWTIPLCRRCHTEYHQEPKEWTWIYRKNWMRYLVNRGE
jgi:hypothetical protein